MANKPHDITKSGVLDSTLSFDIPNWIGGPHLIPLPTQNAPLGNGVVFRISGVKHPDRTMEMMIDGPFNRMFTLRGAIPNSVTGKELPMKIIWGDGVVKLEIGGQIVATQDESQGV